MVSPNDMILTQLYGGPSKYPPLVEGYRKQLWLDRVTIYNRQGMGYVAPWSSGRTGHPNTLISLRKAVSFRRSFYRNDLFGREIKVCSDDRASG